VLEPEAEDVFEAIDVAEKILNFVQDKKKSWDNDQGCSL